jgi:hypothetical protein
VSAPATDDVRAEREALVARLRADVCWRTGFGNARLSGRTEPREAADLIETQAAEIERLTRDLGEAENRSLKHWRAMRALWDVLLPLTPRCRECADFDGRCQAKGHPCDPQEWAIERAQQGMAALSRADRAESEVARLRESLGWYGEQARLSRLIRSEGDAGRQALSEDGGNRARAALQPRSPSHG